MSSEDNYDEHDTSGNLADYLNEGASPIIRREQFEKDSRASNSMKVNA